MPSVLIMQETEWLNMQYNELCISAHPGVDIYHIIPKSIMQNKHSIYTTSCKPVHLTSCRLEDELMEHPSLCKEMLAVRIRIFPFFLELSMLWCGFLISNVLHCFLGKVHQGKSSRSQAAKRRFAAVIFRQVFINISTELLFCIVFDCHCYDHVHQCCPSLNTIKSRYNLTCSPQYLDQFLQ